MKMTTMNFQGCAKCKCCRNGAYCFGRKMLLWMIGLTTCGLGLIPCMVMGRCPGCQHGMFLNSHECGAAGTQPIVGAIKGLGSAMSPGQAAYPPPYPSPFRAPVAAPVPPSAPSPTTTYRYGPAVGAPTQSQPWIH